MTNSGDVRRGLVRALRLDLVGPSPEDTDLAAEVLPEPPSRWYLTGFLVPTGAPEEQRAVDPQEEMDFAEDDAADDSDQPERGPARRSWLPSSMGLSVLVPEGTRSLRATVRWGDYRLDGTDDVPGADAAAAPDAVLPAEGKSVAAEGKARQRAVRWQREAHERTVDIALDGPGETAIDGRGLELVRHVRPTRLRGENGERRALAVSLFVVNRRAPVEEEGREDEGSVFQVELEVVSETPFVGRVDPRGYGTEDPDSRIADLHYRDVTEWATGHNVSVAPVPEDGDCRVVRTAWMPQTTVPRYIPGTVDGVELGMMPLGALADAAAAHAALDRLPALYDDWIAVQRRTTAALSPRRQDVAGALLSDAAHAAGRLRDGIACLEDPRALDAFRTMNRAVAAAAQRRRPGEEPRWYPFQLAFILLALPGLVDPRRADRETVDLLFFPTGGGKTEAYLGLAAFVMVHRRLVHGAPGGCGLAVLMRYTLRLLTLDQLGRAAAVVCALELERRTDEARLGTWPFEIGLWVGRAATPNRMGHVGERDENSARARVLRYQRDSSRFPPLPIESCPWCEARFRPNSFLLVPTQQRPNNLLLMCSNRDCPFSQGVGLPVLTVDEPIYRRLPAFIIATADKFASMPWVGEVSSFFGRVERRDADGFYGPAEPGQGERMATSLPPPDLIIQDELHLMSGPLGSMFGLYETALDALCLREIDGVRVRPKIIASTATVRRAEAQIRALFDRGHTAVFPPPGPDRRDSFFARAIGAPDECRLYLGLAAPGRSPKVLFLRATTTLLAAARRAWEDAGGARVGNPADPYMSLVSYFNALRELGSARRIVEDEVRTRLDGYSSRKRVSEAAPRFADRKLRDPLELTSRVGTTQVAEARRRLGQDFTTDNSVDVALATNMISVGLDVIRLGLMVVSGQPKTAAEYIQASSRVGRDHHRPGLVVALLNLNKPRDRSHYEHFTAWHQSFYRSVEPVSVTPFAPRALDRGAAAAVVALSRLGYERLTPLMAPGRVGDHRGELDAVTATFGRRADGLQTAGAPPLSPAVRQRVGSLLDDWASLAHDYLSGGTAFGYAERGGVTKPLLRDMLDRDLRTADPRERQFRAPRSLRDVEPNVLLRKIAPNGAVIEEDDA